MGSSQGGRVGQGSGILVQGFLARFTFLSEIKSIPESLEESFDSRERGEGFLG